MENNTDNGEKDISRNSVALLKARTEAKIALMAFHFAAIFLLAALVYMMITGCVPGLLAVVGLGAKVLLRLIQAYSPDKTAERGQYSNTAKAEQLPPDSPGRDNARTRSRRG